MSMQEFNIASAVIVQNFAKITDQSQKMANEFASQVTGAFKQAADGMLSLAFASKTNESAMQRIAQVGQTLLESLVKLVLEYELLNPLMNAANSAMGSTKTLEAGWSFGGGAASAAGGVAGGTAGGAAGGAGAV